MIDKMLNKKILDIDGCFELVPIITTDQRGNFTKIFHFDFFKDQKIPFEIKEQYITTSSKNVIRGLHFQLPPYQHEKLVTILSGEVLDVIVDLRKNSPTYLKTASVLLSATKMNSVYLPVGLAHGFCTMTANAQILYNVSRVYHPESDSGILWSSIDFTWPVLNPILSDRDKKFIPLKEFNSPF